MARDIPTYGRSRDPFSHLRVVHAHHDNAALQALAAEHVPACDVVVCTEVRVRCISTDSKKKLSRCGKGWKRPLGPPLRIAAALPAELPGLLRHARTLTGDDARAEDLVQATMVRARARSAGFRGDSSLATWLHRMLHNLAVDDARRSRVR